MSEVKDNNWLDKIKDLLGDTPKDKKDLITLLDTAAKNSLITQDIFQMILGVFSVSEIPVREIMIPRPHMITINVNEELNAVVTKVIESGHSRFPVIHDKPDEILGILHAKDLLKNQIIIMNLMLHGTGKHKIHKAHQILMVQQILHTHRLIQQQVFQYLRMKELVQTQLLVMD